MTFRRERDAAGRRSSRDVDAPDVAVISFGFSVRPDQGESSGYDLGDMLVGGDEGAIDSSGHRPDQGMMIYLSVPMLLDGFQGFTEGAARTWVFYGVDTSYKPAFHRRKTGVLVRGRDARAGAASLPDMAGSLLAATEDFVRSDFSRLPADDIAWHDLNLSLTAFRGFVGRLSRD